MIDEAGGLTTGQLATRIRRVWIAADPVEAGDRYQRAVADRRMICEPTGSGTAHLLALDLPPHRVAAAAGRINRLARRLRAGGGERRTMDQLRADVFLDLLAGTSRAGHSRASGEGVVDIRVDLDTLARLSESPGDLAGCGPVVADIARQVAAEDTGAEWRFTITHPDTGRVVHNGTTRRRPTSRQRRHVEARNPTCVFPGCRMPAAGCDLDHQVPYSEGGPTAVANFAPLCRHDHRVRHAADWTYRVLPNDDHRWTSRLGHTYTTSGTPP